MCDKTEGGATAWGQEKLESFYAKISSKSIFFAWAHTSEAGREGLMKRLVFGL